MAGILYIVATPIGNLEDITYRAIKVLKEVDVILAEDTRETAKLLSHYDIKSGVMTYNQHSADTKKLEILNLLIQGKKIALVTDAGTPGISDPGNELVSFLTSNDSLDVQIVPIPGATSIAAALSISGFNASNFLFVGFWPKKKAKKMITKIKDLDCPVVFFESPFRIAKTIEYLISEFGSEKEMFIGQELTKMHERTLRGKLSDIKTRLLEEEKTLGRIKGELVCILK